MFKPEVLRRPHLVLAHFGANIAVLGAMLCQFFKPRQRVLRFDDFAFLGVGEAIDFLPIFDLAPPFGDMIDLGFTAT